MARITVEDCLEQIQNRFSLVLIAAERTKQLLKGSEPLIDDERTNKEVVTALREIAAGAVRVDLTDFDENAALRGFAGPVSREDLPPAASHGARDVDLPPSADDDDLPLDADDFPGEVDFDDLTPAADE